MIIKFLPKLNDLCFALTRNGFNFIENEKTKNNVSRFALHVIRKNIYSLIMLKIKIPRTRESIIFNYSTINQYNTLRTVMSHVSADKVSFRNLKKTFNPSTHTIELLALLSIPRILFTFWFSNKETRFCVQKNIYQIYLSYGLYLWARLFFKKNKSIKIFITSNDHYFENVPFTFAANNCRISTIYIQHATVTKEFPKLIYTYSLLDGIDALEKYSIKGLDKTTVILTGNPKYDIHLQSKKEQKEIFGICVGLGHSYEANIALIQIIKSKRLNFIVRPHPNAIEKWTKICNSEGWPISNPIDENVFDFINKITVMISGDSNIILEGALYKKVLFTLQAIMYMTITDLLRII